VTTTLVPSTTGLGVGPTLSVVAEATAVPWASPGVQNPHATGVAIAATAKATNTTTRRLSEHVPRINLVRDRIMESHPARS
jgi:hypothetical protein